MKGNILLSGIAMLGLTANAQNAGHTDDGHGHEHNDTIYKEEKLQGITVRSRGVRNLPGATNGMMLMRDELFKAACCNLGESFTTNPSVDVSYSDAATGAKQIKLLGLSGSYVQMLTENLPNYRGAAQPYSLGYVPGPWMKAIQVSKGSSSVRNGYEAITGQINVEYKKPEDEQGMELNLFGDSKTRIEANVDGNVHINKNLSTEILGHYENSFENHDDNGDGFYDMPKVEQYHVQNRWLYNNGKNIFHGGLAALKELRTGGQTPHAATNGNELFKIGMKTNRYEAYAKNAFLFNDGHGSNIAIMASSSIHELNANFGHKMYDVNEKNLYASLIYETNFTKMHNLSAGLSLNHDYFGQKYRMDGNASEAYTRANEKETTPGAYAQYTFDLNHRLVAMAGIRVDHSSVYGTFVTPRFHVKYVPNDVLTIRLSAGKGYRTVHALAEYNYLMASGRTITIDPLNQEEAWNYGASLGLNIPLFNKTLKLNAEYYYTRFSSQAVVDYDSDPHAIRIANLNGKSYSHTLQVDVTYPIVTGLTLTAAYRLNDVKTTYGDRLLERPLTSRYKGLVTASYKTPLGLWQFDATLQLNGGGRMPEPYAKADGTMSWDKRFKSYEQLNMQVTRWFRHFSVYVGAENLTNFVQKNPIIGANDPWGKDFDPTMIWGPMRERMFYAGIRINLGNRQF